MKIIKKILLPTDFSGSAQGAIEMAIAISKNFDTEVVLLHVLPKFTKSKPVLDLMSKNVHSQLSKIQDYLKKGCVNAAEPVILIGNSSSNIVELAKKLDVNLILMGSGEKGRSETFKLGIVTEHVIRNSDIPVWVIKNNTPPTIKNIICPVDFSKPSKRALANAIHLARTFKATLTVLTVIAPIDESFMGLGSLFDAEHKLIATKHREDFEAFLKKFDFEGVEFSKEVLTGKPFKEILNIITNPTNSLLIMGTTGKTSLSKMLIGSVTEKVVREVPCSFITLKSKDIIRLKIKSDIKDLSTHFKEGKKLLKQGFIEDALNQFQICLSINNLYVPAWQNIAKAQERLGRKKDAKKTLKQVAKISESLYNRKIEADIRSRHHLFAKM